MPSKDGRVGDYQDRAIIAKGEPCECLLVAADADMCLCARCACRWIPIGARAGVCTCQKDAVRIDMRLFRDLVPANQLPEELFQDTSDEVRHTHCKARHR